MWGSNYVLLPAGRQRDAKAGAAMEFQVREHIMKARKSAASSEKTIWGSNYVLPKPSLKIGTAKRYLLDLSWPI